MIVVWGLLEDPPTRTVYRALQERAAGPLLVDQACIDEFEVVETARGKVLTWPGFRVAIEDLTSLYLRPYDIRQIPGLDLAGASGAKADRVQETLMSRAHDEMVVAVNPPSACDLNGSKPAQLQLIRRFAPQLSVPRTIVTTTPDEVKRFVSEFGRCIVKSVSGHRSRVRELRAEQLDAEQLEAVRSCPVQVQEWIPGTDFRVHVVGDRVFATRIDSDAMDYRYEKASLSAVELPPWVAEACTSLATRMGLRLAGVDLRRTEAGEWFCFEVNPSPAFSYYEGRTGQPIASAIADVLSVGSHEIDLPRISAAM